MTEIKERIEIVQTPEYAPFLSHLFPALRDLVVLKISPQFEDNDENKIRHTVLEIFNRLPSTEVLRQLVVELVAISMKVVTDDNEDNAVLALKILFDLHKAFRPGLESQVQVGVLLG